MGINLYINKQIIPERFSKLVSAVNSDTASPSIANIPVCVSLLRSRSDKTPARNCENNPKIGSLHRAAVAHFLWGRAFNLEGNSARMVGMCV